MPRGIHLSLLATLTVIALGISATITSAEKSSAASSRKELGVEGTVVTTTAKAGTLPSFLSLGRQGYDLVLGTGSLSVEDIDRAARALPHTRFGIIEASNAQLPSHPKNVEGFVFREEKVGYLAGYLAALMEARRPGRHVVSTIGGIGPHILTSAVKRWDVAVYVAIKTGGWRLPRWNQPSALASRRRSEPRQGQPEGHKTILAKVARIRRDIATGRIRNIPTTVAE